MYVCDGMMQGSLSVCFNPSWGALTSGPAGHPTTGTDAVFANNGVVVLFGGQVENFRQPS